MVAELYASKALREVGRRANARVTGRKYCGQRRGDRRTQCHVPTRRRAPTCHPPPFIDPSPARISYLTLSTDSTESSIASG